MTLHKTHSLAWRTVNSEEKCINIERKKTHTHERKKKRKKERGRERERVTNGQTKDGNAKWTKRQKDGQTDR